MRKATRLPAVSVSFYVVIGFRASVNLPKTISELGIKANELLYGYTAQRQIQK